MPPQQQQLVVLFCGANETIRPTLLNTVQARGGNLLKAIGEAHFFGFQSSEDALSAAKTFQKLVMESKSNDKASSTWRAGLASGEVTISSQDIFGEAVNLAARLEGMASDGDILVTDSIRRSVKNLPMHFRKLGAKTFKGIPNPVEVYALGEGEPEHPESALEKKVEEVSKPVNELFDFSRVEHERVQEASLLPSTASSEMDLESSIPLARVNSKTAPQPVHSTLSPQVAQAWGKRKKLRQKAVGTFLLWSVVVPLAMVGSAWGYALWKKRIPSPASSSTLEDELKKSEVLQALKAPSSTGKKPTTVASYGALYIRTEPQTADILIDGKLVAHQSPVRIKNVPANRAIQLKVRKIGYREEIQLLNLDSDREKKVSVRLKK